MVLLTLGPGASPPNHSAGAPACQPASRPGARELEVLLRQRLTRAKQPPVLDVAVGHARGLEALPDDGAPLAARPVAAAALLGLDDHATASCATSSHTGTHVAAKLA